MTFTITLSYWLIPFILTIIIFGVCKYYENKNSRSDPLNFTGLFFSVVAIILTMIVWITYLVLKINIGF